MVKRHDWMVAKKAEIRKGLVIMATLATFLCAAGIVSATPIGIVNHSFEDPNCDTPGACNSGTFTIGDVVPGWTVNNAGVWDPELFFGNASYVGTDGDQIGWANDGSLSQVLAANLIDGATYTLNIDIGNRADAPFPEYSVNLLAGGVVLASLTQADVTPGSNSFLPGVLTYTAMAGDPIGQALEIRLVSTGPQTNWDNVRLDVDAPGQMPGVPEPSTFVLIGVGMLMVGFRSKRRDRKA